MRILQQSEFSPALISEAKFPAPHTLQTFPQLLAIPSGIAQCAGKLFEKGHCLLSFRAAPNSCHLSARQLALWRKPDAGADPVGQHDVA